MGLEGFAVLSKKQEDLLTKGYCLQSFTLFTLNVASGPLLVKARASQRLDSSTVAKASVQYKQDKVTFTPKRKTDGNSMYVLEYAVNADLKLKGECKVAQAPAPESQESTLSAEYSQPTYKAKLALVHPNPAAKVSATIGNDRVGVALDGKFDFGLFRLVNYNIAHYWFHKEHRFVVKHLGSDKTQFAWGDFVVSYYQTASEKTAVGANVKLNFPRKETTIEFGGSHSLSCCTELKGKVNQAGFLSALISRKFGGLKVTAATQVDLKRVVQASVSDYKMGLRFDFNA